MLLFLRRGFVTLRIDTLALLRAHILNSLTDRSKLNSLRFNFLLRDLSKAWSLFLNSKLNSSINFKIRPMIIEFESLSGLLSFTEIFIDIRFRTDLTKLSLLAWTSLWTSLSFLYTSLRCALVFMLTTIVGFRLAALSWFSVWVPCCVQRFPLSSRCSLSLSHWTLSTLIGLIVGCWYCNLFFNLVVDNFFTHD